jgi:hypothetical protein
MTNFLSSIPLPPDYIQGPASSPSSLQVDGLTINRYRLVPGLSPTTVTNAGNVS